MNRWILGLSLAPLLLAATAVAEFSVGDRFALEPCINGGVSARGLFPTQAEEDRYFAERELSVDVSGVESQQAAGGRVAGH
jgi:hypothetical protein